MWGFYSVERPVSACVFIGSARYGEEAAAKIESRSSLFSIMSLCEPIGKIKFLLTNLELHHEVLISHQYYLSVMGMLDRTVNYPSR